MPERPVREPDIDQAARELRAEITATGSLPVRAFTEFAERYAVDRTLRDEAVVLGFEISIAAERGESIADADMLSLVERIVADYRQNDGDRAIDARARRQAELRDALERESVAGQIVFQGRGVTKTYPGSGFTLGTLDLTLKLGEITGVVGQNAHGKTTLLRIVAGELRQDEGTLEYPALGEGGSHIDWVRVKSRLAYVPQELSAWRGSLRDTLHFEAAIRGIRGAENEREVKFVIERLALGAHLDKRWNELSGGYKLRFALARALVWKPQVLVMDEPLANLDVKAKNVLLQDVHELASSYRYPIAVLMSSHELHALESVCDQMVFLREGTVVYVGPVDAVAADQTGHQFELGTPLSAAELRQRLEDTGVTDVREEAMTFILTTAQGMDRRQLLETLLARGVDVEYFRDNSRSVRRLFQ